MRGPFVWPLIKTTLRIGGQRLRPLSRGLAVGQEFGHIVENVNRDLIPAGFLAVWCPKEDVAENADSVWQHLHFRSGLLFRHPVRTRVEYRRQACFVAWQCMDIVW